MVKQPAALNAGPRGEAVEVKETAQDDESYETSEVILTEMDEIAEFCAFEQHFTAKKASGAIRYDIGRDSNKDLQLVAPPLIFSMVRDRVVPGIVSFIIKFHTVHINGLTGQPAFGMHTPRGCSRGSRRASRSWPTRDARSTSPTR